MSKSFYQHDKIYTWQIYSQHYTKWRKIEIIDSEIRNKETVTPLPTAVGQCSAGSISNTDNTRKEKGYQEEKKRSHHPYLQMAWYYT